MPKKMSKQMINVSKFWERQAAEEEEYIKNMRDAIEQNSSEVDKLLGANIIGASNVVDMLNQQLDKQKKRTAFFFEDEEDEDESR